MLLKMYRIKKYIKKVMKISYKILPLPKSCKLKIKNITYILLTPILKNTYSYGEWKHQYENHDNKIKVEIKDNESLLARYTQQILSITYQGQKESVYEIASHEPIEVTAEDVKYIAFYLPQFHPFKENDEWWGKGFSEWANTTKAVPQFYDHYQPRLAGELGYYDLRYKESIKAQMDLAEHYGISGFCIYYYWFDGHRLLEKPLEIIMENEDLSLPFCLCWANENWTRRWDGQQNDILMAQKYDDDFALKFIRDVSAYFNDRRYIRINGKPVFLVYNPNEISNLKNVINVWRDYCRDVGIGEIHLLAVDFALTHTSESAGFDGFVEFPPHSTKNYNLKFIHEELEIVNPQFQGVVFDYEQIVREKKYLLNSKKKLYKGVMLNWDNTARNPVRPMVFHNFTHKLFKEWLLDVTRYTKGKMPKEERFVFINAWNEWAEGTYLEPDRKYGYSALNSVKRCIIESRDIAIGHYTVENNPVAYKKKWNDIKGIYKSELDNKFFFLCDYLALLNNIINSNLEVEFYAKKGIPYCIKDKEEICLDSRISLAHLYSNQNPFDTVNRIAFVILQFNNIEYTQDCIASLKNLDPRGNINIVIVDNGSQLEEKEKIRELFEDDPIVTLLFNDENIGFAKGNNIGYQYAKETLKASFIIVLNNDVTIEDSDFLNKVQMIYNEWSFSILGPQITIGDGRNENPWNHYVYNNDQMELLYDLYEKEKYEYLQTGIARFERINNPNRNLDIYINPILQGAIYIFSPIFVCDNNNAFDECTFLYGEEFLVAVKAFTNGHLMLYSSKLEVLHHEGVTTSDLKNEFKIINGYENPLIALSKSIGRYESHFDLTTKRSLKAISITDIPCYLNINKKNILMDLFFCQPGFHGGGEYGKAVFKALAEKVKEEDRTELWVAANTKIFMEEWIWDICRCNRIKVIEVSSHREISSIVNNGTFDAFFAPAIVVYMLGYEYMESIGKKVLFKETKTRVLGTLHDVRDFLLVEDKNKREADLLKKMYIDLIDSKYIDYIFTDSIYSKQVIIEKISSKAEKINVLYPPQKNILQPSEFRIGGIEIKDFKYALFLHADRPEKNASNAIKAMDEYLSKQLKNDRAFLLITGISSLKQINISDLKCEEQFICVGYIKSEELEFLYKNAAFLIFASLNEGFGYPPIEAMKYGVPSIVSNVTSIPEICGDAAIYCDPYSVKSIEDAICDMEEKGVSKKLIGEQFTRISDKQKSDLERLIDMIIN